MKKQIIAFVFVILAVGLLFSGCEGTPQGETEQIFQEWNTDIPFKLLAGSSTEVDVTVKSSIDTDQETVRKSASAYIDPDEAEAAFEETRWVKCVLDISLPDNSEYTVLDIAFKCFWGQYPDVVFGSEYYNVNQFMIATSTYLVIEYEQAKDLRSCKAVLYACIPVEDESYTIEILKCVGGSHDTTVPELPDDSVLCWKISDAIME